MEFVCRLLHTKYLLEAPRKEAGAATLGIASLEKESKVTTAMHSSRNSGANSRRGAQVSQSDQEKKLAHEKHLHAFKEFCCTKLDPFFELNGVAFVDPDEDVVLSDSAESEFEYDLPSGYDSNDENNSEFISVMSSGNESSDQQEE